MRIYLDVCCLGRIVDAATQVRVRDEADSVQLILERVRQGELTWVSSTAVAGEIRNDVNLERRTRNA